MKAKKIDYTKPAPASPQRECLPCDIPPFCRNNYYTGKLLTQRDLTAEQRYLIDKSRLHQLALHGWGVVCGLKVKPHPHCPQLRIIVEPGLAIDPCGRMIRVLSEQELELPKLELPPLPEAPCPPDEAEEDEAIESGQPRQQDAEPSVYGSPFEEEESEDRDERRKNPYRRTLYLCIRYSECETEFMPAPFDECACSDSGQKPNRICESYELELTDEEPEGLDKIRERYEACEEDDCRSLYEQLLEGCPETFALNCLPLAIIEQYTPGEAVTEAMIDNWSVRLLLPNTQLLDQLIRCILDKLPNRTLTRIKDIGWTHRGLYQCHEFMKRYIGDENHPQAFEVVFDSPVNPQGITRRTFQAIAVRYAEKWSPGHAETVPAEVSLSKDRTRAYLRIDREYAQRRLDNVRFDLFILLRCDHIIDDWGNAVDGNLLARFDDDGKYIDATPTGNGVPGGLFESWIRVRTGR